MIRNAPIRASLLPATILLVIAAAVAQYQADNRVNPQLNPTGGAQTYRPNDYSVGESIYYRTPHQFMLLPSETLMAEQRSGAMPSELLMSAQRIGPLAPYGSVEYIPYQSLLQRMLRLPPPQLYNPAYHVSPALNQPPPSGTIAYYGTVRSPLFGPWPSGLQSITPQPTHTRRLTTEPSPASEWSPLENSNSDASHARQASDFGYGSIYFSSIHPPPPTTQHFGE